MSLKKKRLYLLLTLILTILVAYQNCAPPGRSLSQVSLNNQNSATTTTTGITSTSTTTVSTTTHTTSSTTTSRTTTTGGSTVTTTTRTTTSITTTTGVFNVRPWPNLNKFYAGTTHVAGRYAFQNGTNFLTEGVNRLVNLGFKAVFFHFHAGIFQPYPVNGGTPWPQMNNLKQLFLSAPFQDAFQRNFEIILLTTYPFSVPGMFQTPPNWEQSVEDEMYNLTREIILRLENSGKTIVLKQWEGDWHLLMGRPTSENPPQARITWMIQWLNARQRGVTRARNELGRRGVRVFNAAEVNRVRDAISGKLRMINAVVPHTNVDMVTYSAWDATAPGVVASEGGVRNILTAALQKINQHAPDPLGLGRKRIIISEFGGDEDKLERDSYNRIQVVLETSRNFGVWGSFFWQLFSNICNSPVTGQKLEVAALLPGHPERPRIQDCRGLWLVRPNNTTAPALNTIRSFWN